MENFKLKPNQILIFTDFNSTLVDFDNEYNNMSIGIYDEKCFFATKIVKQKLTICLDEFVKRTGYEPVICVITNADSRVVDNNGYAGITQDMRMMFFDHERMSDEQKQYIFNNTCEKYFKFLVYRDNDYYFEINPLARNIDEMFVAQNFDEKAKSIRLSPDFRKRESVQRLLSMIDSGKNNNRFMIFAGDSIKDDYPMKLVEVPEGVSKIFIRPGKVTKMKPSIMYEFCKAKGDEFVSVNPKTHKKIKCFDENTIQFLTPEDRKKLEGFSDGDYILLTNKCSRGFIEGLYQSIDIIESANNEAKANEMGAFFK